MNTAPCQQQYPQYVSDQLKAMSPAPNINQLANQVRNMGVQEPSLLDPQYSSSGGVPNFHTPNNYSIPDVPTDVGNTPRQTQFQIPPHPVQQTNTMYAQSLNNISQNATNSTNFTTSNSTKQAAQPGQAGVPMFQNQGAARLVHTHDTSTSPVLHQMLPPSSFNASASQSNLDSSRDASYFSKQLQAPIVPPNQINGSSSFTSASKYNSAPQNVMGQVVNNRVVAQPPLTGAVPTMPSFQHSFPGQHHTNSSQFSMPARGQSIPPICGIQPQPPLSGPQNNIAGCQPTITGLHYPMSGSQSMPYGSEQQQPYLQQSQQMQNQKRLDPDQMPNPIQVMREDEEAHGKNRFVTNQVGLLPPLVSTRFVVEDAGNASPRFIRSSMYSIPCTIDMMKQADVPFALVITPFASLQPGEQPPPFVDTGEIGPIRCVRCKAYMNPYMKFIDGGRRFVCVLCSATTEVIPEYFQHLDHTGARVDRFERPELLYGAYEMSVTKEYCKDNELPNVPAIVFIIDTTYNNMKSGLVPLLCQHITDIVQNHLASQDHGYGSTTNTRTRVGFITYDTSVHFYNIKACLGQPQMMVVGDLEDMFVPILDGFLCDPIESGSVIQSLMQQIPSTFVNTKETETMLLPAVKAGLEALKAAKCAGKLVVFHSTLPTGNVPGKLANREDRKLLGTEKEKVVLAPQNTIYTNLAQECVDAGCSVDLFIFNNSFIDLPTIGQLSRLTGGEIFKYTYFQGDIDGERVVEDLKRSLSREMAFDAVMRVRTSTGTRPVGFYGNIFMRNATDIELATVNSDKSIAVEVKHDDKLVEEEGVFIQVALLYTTCFGDRRVRILNLALKCCSQMADLFRNCELDTLINYWSKSGVTKLLEGTPKQIKESLVSRGVRILACYRRLCANPSSPGQLILPECMKLLPLYLCCLLKSDAISGGSDMTIDDRYFMMQAVSIMDIPSSQNYFYPRMLPLIGLDAAAGSTTMSTNSETEMPTPIRCTSYKLPNYEAYILENGIYMFLWIGSQVPKQWIVDIFGVGDFASINVTVAKLPIFENLTSRKLNAMIDQIQRQRRRTMKLTIVRETDKLEIIFKRFLVEDGAAGSFSAGDTLSNSSYVDFLCYIHKEIRAVLS